MAKKKIDCRNSRGGLLDWAQYLKMVVKIFGVGFRMGTFLTKRSASAFSFEIIILQFARSI